MKRLDPLSLLLRQVGAGPAGRHAEGGIRRLEPGPGEGGMTLGGRTRAIAGANDPAAVPDQNR